MKDHINPSLLTKNKIAKISDEAYLQQHDYLEVVRAFARLTYESVYVIDYEKMAFEYVSENPLFYVVIRPPMCLIWVKHFILKM